MTGSDHPPGPEGPEVPESTISELQALYREAAQAEPDAMLDRSILDVARADLRGADEARARRQPPWWRGWLPAASALAIALVGLSLTWRVMDQQERDLRQEMKAAEAVRAPSLEGAGSAAPTQVTADAPPRRDAAPVAELSRRAESTAIKEAPPGPPKPAAAPAPQAPAVADEALQTSGRAEKEDLRQRRDASAAAAAAASPARQAGKLEAGGLGSASSSETAADSFARPSASPAAKSAAGPVVLPPPDAATPEAWLKQIRELRAAGRNAEAAQSLARFRARYPDFVLPDDLLKLK
jgi:hypothetical protein